MKYFKVAILASTALLLTLSLPNNPAAAPAAAAPAAAAPAAAAPAAAAPAAAAPAAASGKWKAGGFTQWHPQASKGQLGAAGTQCFFCKPDPDGDDDGDGVPNGIDQCPNTPPKAKVNAKGCPLDSDGDGVTDDLDKCPDTPRGTPVDAQGCPVVHTSRAVTTEAPVDSDHDGILDNKDKCPNTPARATVTREGCWVIKNLNFDFAKAVLAPSSTKNLDAVVSILKKNPKLKVDIQGHTDSVGKKARNKTLSLKRAQAAMSYLIKHGIDNKRLSAHGLGAEHPIANNKTKAGRAENRRAELRHE